MQQGPHRSTPGRTWASLDRPGRYLTDKPWLKSLGFPAMRKVSLLCCTWMLVVSTLYKLYPFISVGSIFMAFHSICDDAMSYTIHSEQCHMLHPVPLTCPLDAASWGWCCPLYCWGGWWQCCQSRHRHQATWRLQFSLARLASLGHLASCDDKFRRSWRGLKPCWTLRHAGLSNVIVLHGKLENVEPLVPKRQFNQNVMSHPFRLKAAWKTG